jgi:uncharacterized integral membrane protein (TIGR00698 family)
LGSGKPDYLRRGLFLCAIVVCCLPFWSAPLALTLGLAFGMAGANPWRKASARWSGELLRWSIVGLGFGMDLDAVLQAGRASYVYTGIGIAAAMSVGMLLGRSFRVPYNAAFLISAGTSICGGSAIAATQSILNASEEETAVSLTTVFVLNAVALWIFPLIGLEIGLSQKQFGLWAALAIHDTSSVVGAGLKYGSVALLVGTTVKLVRALWIIPLSLFTAACSRRRAKTRWPWFILLFGVAAWVRSAVPAGHAIYPWIAAAARIGFGVTLFLIGAGLSRDALKQVGWRPLVQGITLWAMVASATLVAVRSGWITI